MVSIYWVSNASYTEINCASDAVFGQYACNQCFDGGKVDAGQTISMLDDLWVNDTENNKVLFKEEQTMPEMHALNDAGFTKKPNDDTFWEYTTELEALYDDAKASYVLPAWKSVSWIRSAADAAYRVDSLPAEGKNAWLMVFELLSHNELASGEMDNDNTTYKECVLYTSAKTETPVVQEETPTPKPEPKQMTQVKTGPELYYLLILIALFSSLVILKRENLFGKRG